MYKYNTEYTVQDVWYTMNKCINTVQNTLYKMNEIQWVNV